MPISATSARSPLHRRIMAVRPTDPEALHLFQLIGAPLLALVQAEAQAAQVSAEFIRRIGFGDAPGNEQIPPASTTPAGELVKRGPGGPLTTGAATAPSAAQGTAPAAASPGSIAGAPKPLPFDDWSNLGELRMARFDLNRKGSDGQSVAHTVQVPILSLLPIPL